MANHLSSRIAARATARQIDAVLMADRAANAADKAIVSQWRRLMAAISQQSPIRAQHHAQTALAGIVPVTKQSIAHSLDRMARHGHRSALEMLGILPTNYLRTAALHRIAHVQESLLLEDDTWPSLLPGGPQKPGIVELVLRALGLTAPGEPAFRFGVRPEYTAPEPTEEDLSAAEKREAFAGFLFPPPSQEQVNRIVYAPVAGVTWEQRLEGATRTSATPQQLAQIVGQGVAQGKMAREIAKDLLPVVDGARSTARRIARTESLRVYNRSNFEAHQGLGDMVQGYQVHATLDENTRPEHAARNGTIYYLDPKPGQKGMDECPHPPQEADGSTAHNCRCYLSPVLFPADYIENDPALTAVFKNAQNEVAPDPVEYSSWFERADEQRRRLAVGGRRYDTVKARLGDNPPWSAFIDPQTGSLLPLRTLSREHPETRAKRIDEVRGLIDQRAQALRRVLAFGSMP